MADAGKSALRDAALVAGAAGVAALATYLLHKNKEGKKVEPSGDVEYLIDTKVREQLEQAAATIRASTQSAKVYPPIATNRSPKRVLVTGGAGFVGSNLVDVLMQQGNHVYVMDNLFTGRRRNIEHWMGHPNFEFFQHDVTNPFFIEVDQIYHLACPASPPHYQYNPIKTLKTSTHGTLNMLGLARRTGARMLLTSTSEIYGDPEVNPQPETYWGNVNTLGPRSCYDEGKRVAESMCYAYREREGVEVRIARIFNTFGPRMEPNDGRVVSNFIKYALQADATKPLQIYGDGEQTRSFQYVSDLVQGLIALMNSDCTDPVNIGNPDEVTIKQFAVAIRDRINKDMPIVHTEAVKDDPKKRRPDIRRAKSVLNWEPVVNAMDGVEQTILYFKHVLGLAGSGDAAMPTVWLGAMPENLFEHEGRSRAVRERSVTPRNERELKGGAGGEA